MRFSRWLNPMLPQTLQIATILFYINAGFSVLSGVVFSPIGFALTAGSVLSGLGLANTVRWGYNLAVAISALGLVPFIIYGFAEGFGELLDPLLLISLVFPVALFALVVHPMSRDYQKVWFE